MPELGFTDDRSLAGEYLDEVEEVLREDIMADLGDAQRLYGAVTSPDFEPLRDWLIIRLSENAHHLETAHGEAVGRTQARIALLREMLDLPDTLASNISALTEGLSTDE